jgi:lactate permease
VILYAGWRRTVEVWPAVLVAGGTFAVGQFTVSNFVGPELTDALSALVSLTAVACSSACGIRPRNSPRRTPGRRPSGDARYERRVFRAYATYGS